MQKTILWSRKHDKQRKMTSNDKEMEFRSAWENRKTFEKTKGTLDGFLYSDIPLDVD